MSRVTIVQARRPASVAKHFDLGDDGRLVKTAVANVVEGLAWSKRTDTAADLADIVATCAERHECCILLDTFIGNQPDSPLRLVSEPALSELAGHRPGSPRLAGIHAGPDGTGRYVARLKRSLEPGGWLLIDADDPPGIPAPLRTLDLGQRLERLDALVPGIATAERVEARSSSARVRLGNDPPRGPSHAYIMVNDPTKIETLRLHLAAATIEAGLAFRSPRKSRIDGSEIGAMWRTIVDLAVLVRGRLVFTARPLLSDTAAAAGWRVHSADVRVANQGGGVLDLGGIELPGPVQLAKVRRITGSQLKIKRRDDGMSLSVHETGSLTLATEIEARGEVDTFGGWLMKMTAGQSLRCETPFRESASEAAFIRRTSDPRYGEGGWLHDVGTGTTHFLGRAGTTALEIGEATGSTAVLGLDEAALRFVMAREGIQRGLLWPWGWSFIRHLAIPKGLSRVVIVRGETDDGRSVETLGRHFGAAGAAWRTLAVAPVAARDTMIAREERIPADERFIRRDTEPGFGSAPPQEASIPDQGEEP